MKHKPKKIILAITALLTIGSVNNIVLALTLGDSSTKISVSNTSVIQGVEDFSQGVKDFSQVISLSGAADSSIYANCMTSVDFTKEFENNSKIITTFKYHDLAKPHPTDSNQATYVGINKNSSSSLTSSSEFLYQKSFLVSSNKLIVNLGVFGFSKCFAKNNYADDPKSQFLTGAFVSDKIIETKNKFGLVLSYESPKIDIAGGYFAPLSDEFDANGFTILQITYKPSKKGNYRLYGWIDTNYKKIEEIYGIGASLDQEIGKKMGVFLKFGYKSGDEKRICKDPEILLLGFWNAGIQIKDIIGLKDTLGLAVGEIYSFPKQDENFIRGETQTELYYRFELGANLSITPSIQYIVNPKGKDGDIDNGLFAYALRTHLKF